MSEKIYRKYEGHPGKTRFASRTLFWIARLLVPLFYRVRVDGLERMPLTGSTLVLSKHRRNDDIPIAYSFALLARRPDAWCVMKDSLAPLFGGFFLKTGGIPINRKNPEKSKSDLLLARTVLYDGNLLGLYPEQTHFRDRMGQGRAPGFRFITGKPAAPIQVISLGIEYRPRRFRRTEALLRFGEPVAFTGREDAEIFLHERMLEIAALSNLPYPFERPLPKKERMAQEKTAPE